MTLSQGDAVTELAANEAELLSIPMQGIATKQAVIEQIWESKGVFVTEGSYHQLVRSLRLKLEEQGVAGSLIKTLPRLGLKFVGAVEPVADTAAVPGESAFDPRDAAAAEASVSVAPSPQAPHDAAAAPSLAPSPTSALRAEAPSGGRRAVYYGIYALLAVWAGMLAWKTFFQSDNTFQFRFQQTVDGVHYFSNGRMEQQALLKALNMTPPPNAYVYQIELGANVWLAVCPKSIYKAPELCEAYFIEKHN